MKLVKEKKPKKIKLPKLSTMRNKCDALLSPIIKKMFPNCMLCGKATEVAHHHVHKGRSTRLRYEIDNLINLCNSCHCALHHNESYFASKITSIKGMDWFTKLDRTKDEYVKVDVHYYIFQLAKLTAILEGI